QTATHANFDWTLYVQPLRADGSLPIAWVVDARRFSEARTRAAQAQLAQLLAALIDDPAQHLDQVRFTGVAEPSHAALIGWPQPAPWRGSCVAQIDAVPADRVAVVDDAVIWRYGDLRARAARLAATLRASGVRRGDVVMVVARRRAALVVAVLGVLRAGAAFAVVDPAEPAARRSKRLACAAPRAVVRLDRRDAIAAPLPSDVAVVQLDAGGWVDGAHRTDAGDARDTAALQPTDLAYLAFTSGSTGEPKAVRGHHGALATYAPTQAERFDLCADDRFAATSALAHDPLQRDLLTPLLLGARLHLPDDDRLLEPGYLAAWMTRAAITVVNLTPALARIAATATGGDPSTGPTRLRRIFLVGDVLTADDAAALRALGPSARVINSFGATETSRGVSYHVARAVEPHPTLPLGQGIGDAQLWVVAAHGRAAGVGELGALMMRTPHLAQGYHAAPAATAARFVPDFLPDAAPGARLYRTGDLGRFAPDGWVRFAGRRDFQVQIR
ncbi:MAG: AMP-binding protein, partial [Acidobacteriota bacterium]